MCLNKVITIVDKSNFFANWLKNQGGLRRTNFEAMDLILFA